MYLVCGLNPGRNKVRPMNNVTDDKNQSLPPEPSTAEVESLPDEPGNDQEPTRCDKTIDMFEDILA